MAQPLRPLPGAKYGPAIMVVVSLTAVAAIFRKRLQTESRTMDRIFSQYQSPQSEESRRHVFEGLKGADPRRSAFNVLSWTK